MQHLVLECIDDIARSGGAHPTAIQAMPLRIRVFNAHMPTSSFTPERKTDCLFEMRSIAVAGDQPFPWMIGGDMNLVDAKLSYAACEFLPADNPVLCKSGWPLEADTQKADCVLCPCLALIQVKSWIGKHSKPCASDVHDAVVAIG